MFGPLIEEEFGIPADIAIDIFNDVMDQAWNHALPYVPQDYLDELDGVLDGAEDAGHAKPEFIQDTVRRIMMLPPRRKLSGSVPPGGFRFPSSDRR